MLELLVDILEVNVELVLVEDVRVEKVDDDVVLVDEQLVEALDVEVPRVLVDDGQVKDEEVELALVPDVEVKDDAQNVVDVQQRVRPRLTLCFCFSWRNKDWGLSVVFQGAWLEPSH